MSRTAVVTDTFARTVSNAWGNATSGQAWTVSGGAAGLYNVAAGVGSIQLEAVAQARQTFLAGAAADLDVSFRTQVSAVAATSYIGVGPMFRRAGAGDYLLAEIRFQPTGLLDVALVSRVASVETTLASQPTALPYAAGTWVRCRVNITGTVFSIKVWLDGSAEPAGPQLFLTTVSTITAANPTGLRAILNTGNTNALNVTVGFADYAAVSGVTALGFVFPLPADQLCGTGTPTVTAVEQLADSVQAFLTAAGLDALAETAADGFPRAQGVSQNATVSSAFSGPLDSLAFNVGTPSDLAVYPSGLIEGTGIWWELTEGITAQNSLITAGQVGSGVYGTFPSTTDANVLFPEYFGGGNQALRLRRTVPNFTVPAWVSFSGAGNSVWAVIAITIIQVSETVS